jgi:hypothetical protein
MMSDESGMMSEKPRLTGFKRKYQASDRQSSAARERRCILFRKLGDFLLREFLDF